MMSFLTRTSFWKLSLLSGVFIGLSYPPLPGFLVWFGLVPLIQIWLTASPKESAKWSYFSSLTANILSLYWLGLNAGAGWIPVFASLVGAVVYLGIFWAGLGGFIAWVHKKGNFGYYAIPFFWVAMEYIRGLGPLGFPWANLATTQTKYLPVIQMAEVTGTAGIGFWILLVNLSLYLILIASSRKKLLITGLVIFILPWMMGSVRLIEISEDEKLTDRTIAILQPNINPIKKWESSFRTKLYTIMDSLHHQAISLNPDLILWPEASLPVYMRTSSSKRIPLENLVKETGIPLLTGTVDWGRDSSGEKQVYNGAIYLGIGGNKMYHKISLVPFAEYIPLSGLFPKLKELNIGQANFTHGDEFTVFPLDSIYFSNMICYESSRPKVVRGFIQNGARFLTIESNDAWSGNTSGAYQHFELAKLRAIETRTSIARSANTGISGLILPSGKVDASIPFGQQAILLAAFPLNGPPTFYSKFGDLFAVLCLMVSLTLIGISWVIRRK